MRNPNLHHYINPQSHSILINKPSSFSIPSLFSANPNLCRKFSIHFFDFDFRWKLVSEDDRSDDSLKFKLNRPDCRAISSFSIEREKGLCVSITPLNWAISSLHNFHDLVSFLKFFFLNLAGDVWFFNLPTLSDNFM